ncbi:hypothetical protein ABE237_07705 [Brevibacillus formosus]|uniref:hypothetical protein n=1 Tax=Brevibacillus formosus TaxID=54913 RepID=UPI001F54A493|nr:hypothetical protein [Brevibacillus formosus]MBG9943460.1 hypothetical protein [Brevibacillus formosus]
MKARISLLTQMVLLISIVVLISMGIGTALFSFILDDILDRYIGQQAMSVAKLSAMDERIISAFETDHPSRMIQPIAETIRMETGASCKFETSAYSNIQPMIKQQWTSCLRKSTFTTFYGTVGLRKKIPLGSAKNGQIMPDGKKKGKLHL